MSPHTIYLGLGTNVGERAANLQAAIDALSPDVQVLTRSPIYQTAPWGFTDQADFLNQVLKAETALEPQDLLATLKNIEQSVGRTETFRYGPREIDIDILFYDDLVFDQPTLSIPHPRVHERAFMLVPLADIAPKLQHPVLGKSIKDLLATLDSSDVTRYQGE